MWGVYGDKQFSLEIRAVVEGLAYLGLPHTERHHNGFSPRNQTEDFSPVVVSGLRAEGKTIRDEYNALGVQCVIVDYGYLSRVSGIASMREGFWQVGINRLGWVPEFKCPPDRFDSLGLSIQPARKSGQKIYVCGQHEGDPSHGMDRNQMVKWALQSIDDLRAVTQREIVWRAHPDSPIGLGNVENSTGPIDWADVFCVVVINSNIGHEALLNGVPVIAQGDAPYSDLANDCFTESLFTPSMKIRKKYFDRLAYAQWTLDEISQGKPFEWLVKHRLTEKRN